MRTAHEGDRMWMKNVFVILIISGLSGCGGNFYRVRVTPQESAPIKAGIWLDKSSYGVSETVVAYVFLKNESKDVLFVNARFAGDFFDHEGEEVTFEIDPDPRYYFRTPDYPSLHTAHIQILYPGEKITCVSGFILANDPLKAPFRFPAGKYKLRAVYTNTYQSKAYGLWTGKIKSEAFEFEVH
jgi:hypothetical protein